MSAIQTFDHWRCVKRAERSWGLAWFLANEFCQRFYSSHGIAPQVIEHEGLGYYGIQFAPVRCKVNAGSVEPLGRVTANGNVENWRSGHPGDHGLNAVEMCDKGVPASQFVEMAITHMDIPSIPDKSHNTCRHKRWGQSFKLCFEIATILALRNEVESIQIWNHPLHVDHLIKQLDPNANMHEHLGAFLLVKEDNNLLVAADGRLLDSSPDNIWVRYMRGQMVTSLANLIEERLDTR